MPKKKDAEYYRDRRAKLREEGEASGKSKRPAKTLAERKREQRARVKAAREAAKLTQTALKPQPSTSRAPEIAVRHEPMDTLYAAATEQTSGPSGWGQQGPVDTDDEMEYIMRDAPSTSRAPVIIMEDETYVHKGR
jgi:hypothetical protein